MGELLKDVFGRLDPVAIAIIAVIVIIFILTVIVNVMVISVYKGLKNKIIKAREAGDTNFKNEVLNNIVDEYITAAKVNGEVNTQAIIENNFLDRYKILFVGERFTKHAVSLMITLGLLGTFYGLTISISKLVELLSDKSSIDTIENIITGLMSSINGMGVAFTTSLFGIIGSIVVTVLNIFYNVGQTKDDLLLEIENYLDNELSQKIGYKNILVDGVTSGNGNGEISYTGNDIGKSLDRVSTGLLMAIEKFDSAIEKFNGNTKDFYQFNHELRTNIERMNVTMGDFISDLKDVK